MLLLNDTYGFQVNNEIFDLFMIWMHTKYYRHGENHEHIIWYIVTSETPSNTYTKNTSSAEDEKWPSLDFWKLVGFFDKYISSFKVISS